jgi:acetoin utilization deacetylase AcuC-like enzyme
MNLTIFTNNITSQSDFLRDSRTNNPILRKQNIISTLQNQTQVLTTIKIQDTIDIRWLEQIHDSNYLNFLKGSYISFLQSSDDSWTFCNGLVPCNFYKTLPSHPLPIYKLAGYYGSDTMTPIFASTYENALISANQAYHGAEYLHKNESNLVYILATSPGHHAKKAEYGGYCFINNIVVAAQRLLELGRKKIGILDLDYHAGNGTYEMTLDNKNIVAYSIHCDPKFEYPSFDGFGDEYNYVLPPKSDWNTYKNVLKMVCNKMMNDNIDVLLIAFGGDTFKNDPDAISIGRFSLELDTYTEMGNMIKEIFSNIPMLITQEGGYDMGNIGNIVGKFIGGIMEKN